MPTAPPVTLRELASRYSTAQRRTLDAALELFRHHGVGGTSLQMIADALGVTKAAVYHQFQTKDAIVLAVIDVQLQPLEALLDGVDDAPDLDARKRLLAGLVDVVVANRRSLGALQNDPVLFRLLGEHPPSLRMWARLFSLLVGNDVNDRVRVRASVLAAAIGAAAYPFVVDLDDDLVRDELLAVMSRLVFGDR